MMSRKTVIGDEMLKTNLKNRSNGLKISVDTLINRYIRRGLFMDDYYEPPEYTYEELIEMSKKYVEKDIKNGIPPKKHNFGNLIKLGKKYYDEE